VIDVWRALLTRLDTHGPRRLPEPLVAGWSPEVRAWLERAAILRPDENDKGLSCDACEEGCWVIPGRLPGRSELVWRCEVHEDMGLLRAPPERLQTWQIRLEGLAGWLNRSLSLAGPVACRGRGWLWQLGERTFDSRRTFYLGCGLAEESSPRGEALFEALDGLHPVLLVPDKWPSLPLESVPILPLSRLARASADALVLDEELLVHRLGRRRASAGLRLFPVPQGARWENLSLLILDSERVELRYGSQIEVWSFVELGMNDGRAPAAAPRPSQVWQTLLLMAREEGCLDWRSERASPQLRDKIRQLRQKLSAVIPIQGEPIPDYSKERAYKTTFRLSRRPA
jgi:hypothetical protein